MVVGIGNARQTGFVLARQSKPLVGLVPTISPLNVNSSLFRSRFGRLPMAADMSFKAKILPFGGSNPLDRCVV
jgi:hypothetical protein